MRELNDKEVKQVSGGNFPSGVMAIASSYYLGYQFGTDLYATYTSTYGTTLGADIYAALH